MSLQFRDKDAVQDNVKCSARVQVDDVSHMKTNRLLYLPKSITFTDVTFISSVIRNNWKKLKINLTLHIDVEIERLRGTNKQQSSGNTEDTTGKSVFKNEGGNISCFHTVHVSYSKLL